MELKGNQMSKDERLLVSAACKSIIIPDQRLWRTLKVIETYDKFADKL